jgi:thioredoxin 1
MARGLLRRVRRHERVELHVRPILMLVALALSVIPVHSAARADAWTVAPTASAPPARCADPAAAALKPNEARYPICADQIALFSQALDQARRENKLLIVDFGATWCPWCRSLQAQWPAIDPASAYHVVEIGLSTMHAGRRLDVPSGQAVLTHVLATTNGVKLRSVPFLAVVDPGDRSRTVARNLDDFEQDGAGRHDARFIRAFISAAHDHIRNGTAAPSEPGWLRAKFNRAWMKLFGT